MSADARFPIVYADFPWSVPGGVMRVWSHFVYDGGFWFRLFGWGLSIENKVKNPPCSPNETATRK